MNKGENKNENKHNNPNVKPAYLNKNYKNCWRVEC